ncbi:hypothetical protein HN592_03330 [Candidatus Woesearchaeota archaeon]|mgnify:CR=1 FL=1|jgi:hypothetical protein|nr:hypothetical protein [Candidatus Woesearchaeota archaeon]MBT4368244.1 hypothetical protein [Candidatus Woesearchaeota archaeon]MBT4712733.1 hypothetical protein [Candidatus Woesearchaeota archaeon]MBT6639645.1 hypothetical protein [Candidatus Woesearchaeota archaeon]MBT7133817.1 hypothetical protein [Candidatus Woesearchaeota archaeon]
MKKRYELLLSEEQEREIQLRAEKLGFVKKSDYIRFMALMESSLTTKLEEILKCLKELENGLDREV